MTARPTLAILALLACSACSDGSDSSSAVVGSYGATTLTYSDGFRTTDLLEAGASLSINLKPDGSTTGSLLVPAEFAENGLGVVYSLEGSYDYDSRTNTVTFDQPADTFVRDVQWQVSGNHLTGVFESGLIHIEAQLTR